MTEQTLPTPHDSPQDAQEDTGTPHAADVPQDSPSEPEEQAPAISDHARVLRIGHMAGKLLDDLRAAEELDAAGRKRLSRIVATVGEDLREVLDDELGEEFTRYAGELPVTPTRGELLIALSNVVGWLEGLLQGIQTAILARRAMNAPEDAPAPASPESEGSGTGNYL